MRVLVVDDDIDYSRLLASFITRSGHEPIVLNHSAEVLDVYLEEKPDLVLIDIIMPGMDGLGVAQEILEMDASARVAFMTGIGDYPDGTPQALRTRVALLSKPLRLDESLFADPSAPPPVDYSI